MKYTLNYEDNTIGLIFCMITFIFFCFYFLFFLVSQRTVLLNVDYRFFNTKNFVKTKIYNLILILFSIGYLYIKIFSIFPEFRVFINGIGLQFNGKIFFFELIAILLFCILSYLTIAYRTELKKEHILFFFFFIFAALTLLLQINFISIFLLIELFSLTGYIIVAGLGNKISIEGSLKYALMGMCSSALLIISLIFFLLYYGTLDLYNISLLESYNYINLININYFVLFCCIFFLISIFFKLAIVPFHQWIIDVYKSSSNVSFLWLVSTTKVILFFMCLIIFEHLLQKNSEHLEYIFIFAGIFSIIIGTFGGLIQTNFKNLFAYSSIVTAGFIIINFITYFNNLEKAAALSFIYLIVYLFNILSFFFFLSKIKQKSLLFGDLRYINNIIKVNKLIGFGLIINFFSFLGLPPLLGFLPKVLIFFNLYQYQFYFSCIIFLIFSLISSFYYFKIIKRISLFQSTELTYKETFNLLDMEPLSFIEKVLGNIIILLNIIIIIIFQDLYNVITLIIK